MNQIPQLLLFYIQLFGFFTLRRVTDEEGYVSIEFSVQLLLWSFLWVTVQTVGTCYALYIDYLGYLEGHPIFMTSGTTMVVTILDMLPLNLTAIVVFITTVRKYRHYVRVCEILEQVDRNLQIRLASVSFTLKLLFICSYVSVLLLVNTLTLLSENPFHVFYLPTWTCYFVKVALFCHFNFVTNSIERRFHIVNLEFQDQVMKQSVGKILIKDLSLSEELIPGFTSLDAHVTVLIDSYAQLCEAVREANVFYCSQLLVEIFSIFIHIIITLYFFFLRVWPRIRPGQEMASVLQAVWAFTHISQLILLVLPSTRVSEAASETGAIVCQLLSTDLDVNVRKKLETFLLQLLHYNTRFTALGFFQVHSHILTSIASSVTTYLVILIQFQISSPN